MLNLNHLPPIHPAASLLKHFFPALQAVPGNIPPLSIETLQRWYLDADPATSAAWICLFMSNLVWIVAELTGNDSIVDRLWTFLPLLYSVHFTLYPRWTGMNAVYNGFTLDGVDPRMALILGLHTLWCIGLTYKAYKRGFFNLKTEDYRWVVFRNQTTTLQRKLFGFFFIAFAQNVLLALAALPQYLLLTTHVYTEYASVPLGIADYLIALAFIINFVIKAVADYQQQYYQHFKRNPPASTTLLEQAAIKRGFVTSGLFAWSRHPNFACEQLGWWILYLYTLRVTTPTSFWTAFSRMSTQVDDLHGAWNLLKQTLPYLLNYSILGPVTMTLLFDASTVFTEKISSSKYALYKDYQKRVGMFYIPTTIFKGLYLSIIGERRTIDELIFDSAAAEPSAKEKKGNKMN